MSMIKYIVITIFYFVSSLSFAGNLTLEVEPLKDGKALVYLLNGSNVSVKIHENMGLNDCLTKSELCIEFKDVSQVNIGNTGGSFSFSYKKLDPTEVSGSLLEINSLFNNISLKENSTVFRLVYFMPDHTRIEGKWMVWKSDNSIDFLDKSENERDCK